MDRDSLLKGLDYCQKFQEDIVIFYICLHGHLVGEKYGKWKQMEVQATYHHTN